MNDRVYESVCNICNMCIADIVGDEAMQKKFEQEFTVYSWKKFVKMYHSKMQNVNSQQQQRLRGFMLASAVRFLQGKIEDYREQQSHTQESAIDSVLS